MNRTEPMRGSRTDNTRTAKDADVVLGNGIATALVIGAIVLAVIGLLVGFEILGGEDNANPFQDGVLWLITALVTAICANVFRREHHVVDTEEYAGRYNNRTTV